MVDRDLAAIDQEAALVGGIIAEKALHQCRLASTILTEKGVHSAGPDLQRDIGQGSERPKAFGNADCLSAYGSHRLVAHGRLSTKVALSDTAPNTPPCILTILIAASWLHRSVAPQQSSRSRHSNPRSLASRMVVWTHTSVVMPLRTMLRIPRVRRISSRSVAQKDPLPGLSMMTSCGRGASSGMISQPGSPRTRILPHGPASPMPAPIRAERQRLFSGRSERSGRCPSRVWMM